MLSARLQASAGFRLGYPPQLLLNGEGANAGTSILDSSGNAFTLTNSGVTTSTAQFKKGTSSMAFGTSGYLVTPATASLLCAPAADWTIDFYMYVTSIPDGAYSCLMFSSGGGGGGWGSTHNLALYLSSAMKLYLEYRNTNGSTTQLTIPDFGTAMPQNQWVHLALTYSSASNTMKTYINGVLDTTNVLTNWGIASAAPRVTIGRIDLTSATQVRPYGGFMDQYRITQGSRWATNFTPD